MVASPDVLGSVDWIDRKFGTPARDKTVDRARALGLVESLPTDR